MKYTWVVALTLFSFMSAIGQDRILEGQILNKQDSLPLAYSTIHVGTGVIGVVADSTGKFRLKIPEQHLNDTLYVSHLGFNEYKTLLNYTESNIDFYLEENPIELNEVNVIYNKSSPKLANIKEIRTNRKTNNSIFYRLNIHDAINKAKDENKLVLLYFSAKWCGPCNWMELHVFNDSTITNIFKEQFIAVKLDADNISSEKAITTYEIEVI